MAYRLRSFMGSDPVDVSIPAGNRKQARKAIRALFPNEKVKFSLDRVYVGNRKLFYQRDWRTGK